MLSELDELIVASFEELKEFERNDPCKDIDKETQPVEYRLAELQKTWLKA